MSVKLFVNVKSFSSHQSVMGWFCLLFSSPFSAYQGRFALSLFLNLAFLEIKSIFLLMLVAVRCFHCKKKMKKNQSVCVETFVSSYNPLLKLVYVQNRYFNAVFPLRGLIRQMYFSVILMHFYSFYLFLSTSVVFQHLMNCGFSLGHLGFICYI